MAMEPFYIHHLQRDCLLFNLPGFEAFRFGDAVSQDVDANLFEFGVATLNCEHEWISFVLWSST